MVGEDKKWGLVCDLGVLFQGSPEVDFSADGLIAESRGHFDEAEYRRQLERGADGTER